MAVICTPGLTRPPRRHRRPAFTLVELLVVIGIIAVLVAILLPALQAARRQAAMTKCASGMRQIGMAFRLYAIDNRGKYPALKWDCKPSPISWEGYDNIKSLYWDDFLAKYVTKGKGNDAALQSAQDFQAFRQSVFFGCPAWDGNVLGPAANRQGGVDVNDCGYAMNAEPTFEPNYPAAGTHTPYTEWAMDAPLSVGVAGKPTGWFQATRWTHPAERALLVETTLWFFRFNSTDPANPKIRTAAARYVDYSSAGWSNIDLYRHGGKYPPRIPGTSGLEFDPKGGGKVATNVLFADGHVAGLHDPELVYRSVQMR
jgi:prepilin-type N-terminal cleavage/methylation domain-containing protein/prepilin-type processing-associated H-X9-DG protein